MKRILSLAVAASMLLTAIPAMAETATKATYIPAPYNAEEVNPTKTYLEPVFYQNENGPTIGVTTGMKKMTRRTRLSHSGTRWSQ